jgi:hypothetical protein
MSKSLVYAWDTEDLTTFANQVKDVLAETLELPELDSYTVIVGQPSMFGRLLNHLTKKEKEDGTRLLVFKAVRKKEQSNVQDKPLCS